MPNILTIAAISFLSTFSGKTTGLLLAAISKKRGRRFEGSLSGFTGGLLIAFICFEILEEGFNAAPLAAGVIGILAGVGVAAYLDGAISKMTDRDKGMKTSLLTAVGVMLHNFPEGMALGAMCAVSLNAGISLALILAIHTIPEAIAIFISLKGDSRSKLQLLGLVALLSLPMTLGSIFGVLLTGLSGVFPALSLTFAGGVMLYITCGEILPESKKLWNGRLTTVCAALGFILGVVITA